MTDKQNLDNPQAFPRTDDSIYAGEAGMTLRDYYAGHALAAIITRASKTSGTGNLFASASYEYADAMLAERAKK